jgi:hypothetical protein
VGRRPIQVATSTLVQNYTLVLVLVEMFKALLVMIQRRSANPYARETEKGTRPGGAVKVPAYSQPHSNSDC